MGVPLVDFLVIAFYLVLILVIGVHFSRFMKGGKDFFIGGNLIPWWAAGISLYMTTFSAWMFTGAASFAYNTGWFGLLYFFVQPIGFWVGFQLSAVRWRRTRVTSPVEYVQARFNKSTQLLLSLILSLSLMYWPAHHLASLSKICAPTLFPNSMTAIDVMIVVFGVIVLIYTFSGGLWAVCVTDVVQFLILFAVCSVLIIVCFTNGEVGSVWEFVHKVPPLEFRHVIRDKTVYTHWYLIGFLAAKVFGNAVGDKAQRFYSVKDEKAARKVGWMAFALFMTGPILFGVPPLVGKVLWPDISQLHQFSQITKPDENIYIAVVLRYMPAGIVGLFLSAMMAASMSALDSVWNTVSSIVSIDIYKNLFKPHADDLEVLRVGRITVLVLFVFAVVMALTIIHSSYGIFTFSNIFFGLTGVPIAIPLLLGILVKDITRWSAMSSILAGTLMASVARFLLGFQLGPQYLLTIAMTLLFIFTSVPLARLYQKNRGIVYLTTGVFSAFLVIAFFLFNENPQLDGVAAISWLSGQTQFFTPSFWALLAACGLGFLLCGFARYSANDINEPRTELEEFFTRLNTPIDVEKEVLKGRKETSVFPLVGVVSILFAVLSLLVLIAPVARGSIGINLGISAILFLIGAGLILAGRQQRRNWASQEI
ncbi:hypothetical protein JW992_14100 [candidate division KSB1 bacterium]|nr:hypothetical protein [candidate division KSB1 bacterium]